MINKITLLGNVGQDPTAKIFDNGGSIAEFSLATTESWKDKTTGEKKEATEWHNCVVNGPLVEVVKRYVKKGSKLYIEGKIKTRSWGEGDQKKYRTEVIVNTLKMLDGKPSEAQPAQPARPTQPHDAPMNLSGDDDNNDLPF
jgi:single-strand DNA-binding protein